MSIPTKLQNKGHVIEALGRAKFRFPGHQKIHISKKWGFAKFNADEFEDVVAEKRLIPDGLRIQYSTQGNEKVKLLNNTGSIKLFKILNITFGPAQLGHDTRKHRVVCLKLPQNTGETATVPS
ncbi:hypothetical protein GH733_011967 [Mirounga leonina]|nr:hypothetical protein GH733_011967 [Mirounga leonina]